MKNVIGYISRYNKKIIEPISRIWRVFVRASS